MATPSDRVRARRRLSSAHRRIRRTAPLPLPRPASVGIAPLGDVDGRRSGARRAASGGRRADRFEALGGRLARFAPLGAIRGRFGQTLERLSRQALKIEAAACAAADLLVDGDRRRPGHRDQTGRDVDRLAVVVALQRDDRARARCRRLLRRRRRRTSRRRR